MKKRTTKTNRKTVSGKELLEEERLLAQYERGELRSIAHAPKDLRHFERAARATLTKNRRLNIRLSSPVLEGPVLEGLQARAAAEGLPYQTLIASVLHKFVTGRLFERP